MDKIKTEKLIVLVFRCRLRYYITTRNFNLDREEKGSSLLRGMNFLTHRHKVGPASADSQVVSIDRELKTGQRG